MTIRRLWLIVLISVSIISIGINAVILTSLTDKYFTDYLAETYDNHMNQVIEYTKTALLTKETSYAQMAIELETHLDDPIIHIKLYNSDGKLLIDVEDDYSGSSSMMNGRNMRGMMNGSEDEVEQYTIEENGTIIGILNVTRNSSTDNSFVARMFKSSMLLNSIYSIVIAIIVAIVIGIIISEKMSKALRETAEYANDIQLGLEKIPQKTNIKEVNSIRESLVNLNSRLKLKQKSRKVLVDQLVHQSRTPLTVLKSHLEAMEDGIIEINSEEINICQDQINNITNIISNMSGMIDANRDTDEVKIETFEFNQLIEQITAGLKAQFDKKNILLELKTHEKVKMETDKYKLSQSIYNILTNAYKYTKEKNSVKMSYYIDNGHLVLKIQDTGIGISKSDINNIFNAYFKCNIHENTSGEGIGLYIVSQNLKSINGSVKVESELGVGSIFEIEVPITIKDEL